MSDRKAAESAAPRGRGCRPGLGGSALALLVLAWTGTPGDVRADTIVLKSGEVVEGSIIDATRNTVIVQPAIGGMRQMPLRAIAEVRIDLAQGQRISGQLLSWADGVYQVRSGGQVVRISEGDVLSREPGEAATGTPERDPSRRPLGPQTVRMAAAPSPSAPEETAAPQASAREPMAAPGSAGGNQGPNEGDEQDPAADEERSLAAPSEERTAAGGDEQGQAADEEQSLAEGEEQSRVAGDDQSPAADEAESLAAVSEAPTPAAPQDQSPAADQGESLAEGEEQSPEADEERSPAEEQSLAALGQNRSPQSGAGESLVAVKAFVAPAEPGADQMVFRIELSRPAEQTLVLIYGTVEGTAKAGEDFEPKQGMVTLAPGSKSASVLVPLIEQPPGQGEKQFELFLTADPKVAEVVDRRIIATIDGGD